MKGHAKASSAGSSQRLDSRCGQFLWVALLLAASLLAPSSSLAAEHLPLETFGSANEPSFTKPTGMAVDPASGDLLVIDLESKTLSRYHEDGTPADFSALGSNVIDGKGGADKVQPGAEQILGNAGEAFEAQVAVAPPGAAAGTEGNIYVTELIDGVIDIFDSTGQFIGRQVIGTPCGVSVAPNGDLYVGSFSEVHRLVPSGPASFSEGPNSPFPVSEACQVAAGAGPTEGSLFAVSIFGKVTKFDGASGVEDYEVDSGAHMTASVDPSSGHLFAVRGEEVTELDASGPSSATELSSTPLSSPGFGVAANADTGNLYATREGETHVEVFSRRLFLETFGSANEPTFTKPAGMAVDPASGDLLVIDLESKTLSRYHEDGTPADFSALGSNVIDGKGGADKVQPGAEQILGNAGEAFEAQVAVAPPGAAAGTEGNIYVTDGLRNRIVVFDSTGQFIGQREVGTTCGVSVAPSGDLYVGGYTEVHRLVPSGPASFSEGPNSPFPVSEACQVAAGAGPTEGSLFAVSIFGKVTKFDGASGVEDYEVDSGAHMTASVDPSSGHLFAVKGEEVIELDASGPSSATEITPPILLASPGFGVAVNGDTGNLYATREGETKVEVFNTGSTAPPRFELSIEKTGNGSGTVISVPKGIDCGSKCSAEFDEGQVLELIATPAGNSEFAGWSTVAGDPGTCTATTSPCEVTIAEATELEAQFALKAPTVTGISPNEGPLFGANPVTITGTDLANVEEVKFGSSPASLASLVEISSTKVKIDAPAHAVGTVDVILTTAGGSSANTAADNYTYVEAPAVGGISPTEGPTIGGDIVTISGSDLVNVEEVKFGNVSAALGSLVEVSPSEIEIEAPAHSAGTFAILVKTPGGPSADTPSDDFTYVGTPAITALSPPKGPTEGGNQVEITGLRLAEASKVEFGDVVVEAPFIENTATKIKLNAPAHPAGKVNVKVTTLGGASLNFPVDDYTYEIPAAVSPLNPTATAPLITSPPPPPLQCVVPKLKGLRLKEAKSTLASAHCRAGAVSKPKPKKGKSQGPLLVKASRPGSGAALPAGSEVDLTLAPKPRKRK